MTWKDNGSEPAGSKRGDYGRSSFPGLFRGSDLSVGVVGVFDSVRRAFLALLYWAESSFAELGPRRTYVAIAIFVVYAVALYMGLAVNVKRCHDRGHSGWFVLLSLIPLVNIWYVVEVCFLAGQNGPNRFGPDPKATALSPIFSVPSPPTESRIVRDSSIVPNRDELYSTQPRHSLPGLLLHVHRFQAHSRVGCQ
jgi:uncharacterized membrane protein YhaH (DUF805 family)